MRRMIKVEAIEFDDGGRTLWVQGLYGTVLRIQLPLGVGFETKQCVDSKDVSSHVDLTIEKLMKDHPVVFCLGNDLEEA